MKDRFVHWFIIGTFVSLYLLVSIISTIHVVDFFELSNTKWLAITLAIAFEVGAAASLASLVTLEKMNKSLVFGLFITLTLFQAMGNSYYAFVNLEDFRGWIELFGLQDEELIFQKRVLSIISGGILPLVALGFIKSLVDYIKPDPNKGLTEDMKKTIIEKENEILEKEDDADEWDEDHALDMVMNRMVDDLSEEEIDNLLVDDENDIVEEDKYNEDNKLDKEAVEDIKTFNEVLKNKKSIDEDLQLKQPPKNKTVR
tara:strand:+ start:1087 stop:1857 length:771 start_codon:yes stop_codon:yes gene_type:complete